MLFKGGVIKSINQNYNKLNAKYQSDTAQGIRSKINRTGLCVYRDCATSDYMHKTANSIVNWCVDHNIDTIVIGENKLWKQNINMGSKNNQKFAFIPLDKLKWDIHYRAERHGIKMCYQEESYTSKASFLDNDYIPVYGHEPEHFEFSGTRGPGGNRGQYKSANGTIINADLNGSANILRKAFPDAFVNGIRPDFSNTRVIKHP